MPLFFLLLFRSNVEKEDNTEDKLDGLQKQTVSQMCCIGTLHDLYYQERNDYLGSVVLGNLIALLQLH